MKLKSFEHMNCSLAQTLDVIGERWTLLILRDAFFGIRRFDDFQRDLGIARNWSMKVFWKNVRSRAPATSTCSPKKASTCSR